MGEENASAATKISPDGGGINWENVIVQALDWPFLLFVLLAVLFVLYRKHLLGILQSGDIQISWGENRSISLKNLSTTLDEELDPLREEVAFLQEQIDQITKKSDTKSKQQLSTDDKENAIVKMKDGLQSHKYRWRSIERLAVMAGVTEEQAHDLLGGQNDVVISKGKSGRIIARLSHR